MGDQVGCGNDRDGTKSQGAKRERVRESGRSRRYGCEGGRRRDCEGNRMRDRERLARFRLIDDTFVRAAFRDQLPLAQHVLRKLTGIPTLVLAESETQRDLNRATGSRGVVLDVYGKDESGNQYDGIQPQPSPLSILRVCHGHRLASGRRAV